jgi:hypothetical protein
MIDCCKLSSISPIIARLTFDLNSTVVTVFGRQDGAEVGYNPASAVSARATLSSASKPTPLIYGIPICAQAIRALGTAASNSWTLALPIHRPTFGKFAFVRMPALASTRSSKLWTLRPRNTPWLPA